MLWAEPVRGAGGKISMLQGLRLLLVITTGLAFYWPAVADSPLVLVNDPYPPYIGENLPKKGLAAELAEKAFDRAGYKIRIEIMPWARALAETKEGLHDALICAWFSEERNQFLHFSQPYAISRVKFIHHKLEVIPYQTLADLKGKNIAVIRGYAYSDEFLHAPDLKKIETASFETAMRMVVDRRADLTLEEERVAAYIIKGYLPENVGQVEFLQPALTNNPLHIAVSRKRNDHQDIVDRFNRALATMKSDGSFHTIYRNHGFEPDAEESRL